MKSFKAIMSEVAQPKSPEEKKFKDMHSYETKSHPVAPDAVFTGAIGADDLIVNSEASFGVFELKDPRKPAEYPTEYKLTAKNKPLLVKSFAKAFYVLLQGIKKHKIKKIKIDGNYPRGMSREYDKLIANKAFQPTPVFWLLLSPLAPVPASPPT